MHASLVITVLLAVEALASPSRYIAPKRRASDSGFSLEVQRKSHAYMPSGAEVRAKTYAKYNSTIPDSGSSSFGTNTFVAVHPADGSVAANPEEYDQAYLAPVYVGGQMLNLDLDTGSSDFWVYSTFLPAAQQAGHDVYSPNKSSTAHRLANETWEITYGDGSAAYGDVWSDCVWIGGTVVEKQAIETATQVSASFTADQNLDGILGLAFDQLNSIFPVKQPTMITNAIKQGLQQPLFTATLKHQAAGSYDFGYIDNSKYTGAITYVPVDATEGYWQVTSTDFGWKYANGSSENYPLSNDVILDTGTSITFLGSNTVLGYWSTVPSAYYDRSAGGYVFACDDTSSIPDFTLAFGNYTAVMPGAQMAYAPVTNGSQECFAALQPNTGLPFSILGDSFLKNVFVVFNQGDLKVGFADQA